MSNEKGKKHILVKVIIALLAPIVIYTVITAILILVRGNCFSAYYVYIGENKFISYNNSYYIQLVEEEQLEEMDENIEGKWFCDDEIVGYEPVKFPYLEYWVPEIMCDKLWYIGDKQYISASQALSGHCEFYQLVEE